MLPDFYVVDLLDDDNTSYGASVHLALRPGTDVDAVASALSDATGFHVASVTPTHSGSGSRTGDHA
jgi:pentose-5-phosphate-3-epimerase